MSISGEVSKERPQLRLAIHDFGGYPFIVQLARALAGRGHEVLHLYASGFRTPKGPMTTLSADSRTFSVEGVELAEPIRRSGYRRVSQERRYGRQLARRLAAFEPELVISANAPLEVQLRVLSVARAGGAAFVFWVQDLHGVAITRILGRRYPLIGNLIGQRFARLETRLFRDSDAIVAISSDYLPSILGSGVDEDRVSVVENWAPLGAEPNPAGSTAWARSHGLGARPVILYAGTLALKHNPALLLDLAAGLPQATVVAVTEGPGAGWLREHGSHIENLRLLPQQPYEDLGHMLGAADLPRRTGTGRIHLFSAFQGADIPRGGATDLGRGAGREPRGEDA
jgi:hypothetical protein